MEIKKLKEEIKQIKDPRRRYGNLRHNLEAIIVIGLLTIICIGEDFTDMESFGKEREEWLKTFLELPNGIPHSDTFRRVFERINPNELTKCLNNWLDFSREKGEIVNIDGKTIRGSANDEHKAYHVVSAWVAENQITLGEIKTAEKSNEITAIPELLEMIDVEESIVTIDAMGCQKNIVKSICENKADYVIGLKGNQENLLKSATECFINTTIAPQNIVIKENGHGRKEIREYFLITDIENVAKATDWVNFNAIGAVKSTVLKNNNWYEETRYFITSLTNIDDFAYAVRKHWSIENQLHWRLDVVFREDSAKAKKDNSPLNLNVLRKVALSLLGKADLGRIGLRKKMFKAALNISVLEFILCGKK